ncbi:MAG: adenosine kinase [DPANN group archaeon]|nr:adenosine kinase [DPANN group archaeon]
MEKKQQDPGKPVEKTYDLFGLGSAVMDVLVMAEETELLSFDIQKGMMKLIEEDELGEILRKIAHLKPLLRPGGSVANTCAGMVRLGGNAIFCSLIGKDEQGALYEEKMRREGIAVRLTKEEGKGLTATAITFITPDSERSFATHLGIALKTATRHIVEEDIRKAKVAHFEGYMLEGGTTREATEHAMELARKHNTRVSLDVSDKGVIQRIRPYLKKIIANHVDILFLNEEEAAELTGKLYSEAAQELGRLADIVIVKIGKQGSLIFHDDRIMKIKGVTTDAVDTTGAGDMYAAGFLYGHTHGLSLGKSGAIASMASAKVVENIGARIDIDLQEEVKRILDEEAEQPKSKQADNR